MNTLDTATYKKLGKFASVFLIGTPATSFAFVKPNIQTAIMRSSRSSSDASVQSTIEAADNYHIFVRLLSGESMQLPFLSLAIRLPNSNPPLSSHPSLYPLLNNHYDPLPTPLPAYLPSSNLPPPGARRQTSHHILSVNGHALLPQHLAFVHHRHHSSSPRRHAPQENPLHPQGLQRARPAHRRGLQFLQWSLLRQTSHARGSQVQWPGRLQEGESRAKCGQIKQRTDDGGQGDLVRPSHMNRS